jgi:transcriptional regulator with XRE-family HTH domain
MSLGHTLKTLRTRNNLSLQQLADAVGASKAHIWDLETGRAKNPSIELLTSLARCFNVTVADLVGENPAADGENPELIAMYRDLKELSEADRAAIKSMMEHFIKRDKPS